MIWSLLYRAFHLSSSYKLFQEEVVRIKDMLLHNGYPSTVYERCINTFLRKIFQPKPVTVTMSGRPITIELQYIGKHSLNVRAQLRRLVIKFYSQVELKIYIRSAWKMSLLFPIKDSTPFARRSKVVYCYMCAGCDAATLDKPHDISKLAFESIWAYRL